MSGINIDVRLDTSALLAMHNSLTSREIRVSIARAINFSLRRTRTRIKREITGQYKIPASDVLNSTLKVNTSNYTTLKGSVSGKSAPESLGHFRPTSYRDVLGGKRGGGYIKTSKRGKGYVSTKSQKNTSKSGVYVEVVRGRKEALPGAFLIFRGTYPLVMARGQYHGPAGFKFSKPRLPINKLNTKSIYWGALHPQVVDEWDDDAKKDYMFELERQLLGACKF